MQRTCFVGLLLLAFVTAAPVPRLEAQAPPSAAHPAGAAHRAFVAAVAERNLPEARTHMSRALIAALPELGGLARVCADRVGPGEVIGIQTLSTEVKSNTAVVSYRFQLGDGSSRFGKEAMVIEDGTWKLDVKGAR